MDCLYTCTENSMSLQALRQLSLFGRTQHVAVFLIDYSSLELFFILLLFYVLFRTQKWGMDMLGITRFFRQRAQTRNFRGLHPQVTSLATHKLFLFSSQYNSSEISCCPYRTFCTTPTEACGPGDARISQSKKVKISCHGHSS